MRTTKTLAIASLLLSPLAATATDLTFSIGAEAEYDDNALRQRGDEEDDVLFRFRPEVEVHEDRGQDVRYSLSYAVPFEFAVENGEELDDIDHDARGQLTYHASDRLELFASDSFRYLRGALQEVVVEDVLAGDDTLLVNQERDRVALNDAVAGLTYRFTPRLSGTASVSHNLFDSQRKDRADNWQLEGTTSLSYVVTPRHSVGMGLRYIHQDFDDRSNIPGSQVDSYNVFAQWTFRFSETLQFEMAVGPSLIDSRQDDPDSSISSPAIPFLTLPDGFNLTGSGLVNPDGTPAAGVAPNGSLVVSQLAACPTLTTNPVQVFAGTVCPIPNAATATPATAGVFIDSTVPPVLNAVQTSTNLMDPFAEGEDDTILNVFGQAVLRKDWTENLFSALSYERTQGGASGLGGAVISDYVQLASTWNLAERWQLAVRGDWVLRRSVVDQGVSQFVQAGDIADPNFTGTTPAGAVSLLTIRGGDTNQVDTMRYGVAGRLTRRFTRNTSGWLQLTYNEQTSTSDTLGDPSDFENFLAVVGVRHVFDPIKLW